MGSQSVVTIDAVHLLVPPTPWAAFTGRPFCYCARNYTTPGRLEHRQHALAATASGESSENVRAYSATTKRMELITKFASTESHIHLGNDDPDLISIVRGMGPRSGPGSRRSKTRTGPNLTASRPSTICLLSTKEVGVNGRRCTANFLDPEQAGVLTATTWTKSSRSLLALWQSQLGAPSNGFLRFLPRQLAVFGLAHRVRFIVSSSR